MDLYLIIKSLQSSQEEERLEIEEYLGSRTGSFQDCFYFVEILSKNLLNDDFVDIVALSYIKKIIFKLWSDFDDQEKEFLINSLNPILFIDRSVFKTILGLFVDFIYKKAMAFCYDLIINSLVTTIECCDSKQKLVNILELTTTLKDYIDFEQNHEIFDIITEILFSEYQNNDPCYEVIGYSLKICYQISFRKLFTLIEEKKSIPERLTEILQNVLTIIYGVCILADSLKNIPKNDDFINLLIVCADIIAQLMNSQTTLSSFIDFKYLGEICWNCAKDALFSDLFECRIIPSFFNAIISCNHKVIPYDEYLLLEHFLEFRKDDKVDLLNQPCVFLTYAYISSISPFSSIRSISLSLAKKASIFYDENELYHIIQNVSFSEPGIIILSRIFKSCQKYHNLNNFIMFRFDQFVNDQYSLLKVSSLMYFSSSIVTILSESNIAQLISCIDRLIVGHPVVTALVCKLCRKIEKNNYMVDIIDHIPRLVDQSIKTGSSDILILIHNKISSDQQVLEVAISLIDTLVNALLNTFDGEYIIVDEDPMVSWGRDVILLLNTIVSIDKNVINETFTMLIDSILNIDDCPIISFIVDLAETCIESNVTYSNEIILILISSYINHSLHSHSSTISKVLLTCDNSLLHEIDCVSLLKTTISAYYDSDLPSCETLAASLVISYLYGNGKQHYFPELINFLNENLIIYRKDPLLSYSCMLLICCFLVLGFENIPHELISFLLFELKKGVILSKNDISGFLDSLKVGLNLYPSFESEISYLINVLGNYQFDSSYFQAHEVSFCYLARFYPFSPEEIQMI